MYRNYSTPKRNTINTEGNERTTIMSQYTITIVLINSE